jgi:hypothetical protein
MASAFRPLTSRHEPWRVVDVIADTPVAPIPARRESRPSRTGLFSCPILPSWQSARVPRPCFLFPMPVCRARDAADDRDEPGGHDPHLSFEEVRQPLVVGIQEGDVPPACQRQGPIPRGPGAGVRLPFAMQSAALAGITTETAGDPISFGISTALRPSSLLFRGDVAAQVCFFSATQVCFFSATIVLESRRGCAADAHQSDQLELWMVPGGRAKLSAESAFWPGVRLATRDLDLPARLGQKLP